MSKEAMTLALNALEDLIPLCDPGFSVCYDVNKAITALREALAEQPAQQEPVAKYIGECSEGSLVQLYDDVKKGTDFYTSPQPAQRTWVGLTDEEVINVMPDDDTPMSLGEAFSKFAEFIEAKLKEKNT